jgi:hypothetical protein
VASGAGLDLSDVEPHDLLHLQVHGTTAMPFRNDDAENPVTRGKHDMTCDGNANTPGF